LAIVAEERGGIATPENFQDKPLHAPKIMAMDLMLHGVANSYAMVPRSMEEHDFLNVLEQSGVKGALRFEMNSN